jgi:hypothetical protein
MKKHLLSFMVMVLAIAISAFTTIGTKHNQANKPTTTYDWYTVDYSSNPNGEVPSGATKVFDDYTKADAQAEDGCTNTVQKHCLRGFITTPAFPTTSYDESTPRPN